MVQEKVGWRSAPRFGMPLHSQSLLGSLTRKLNSNDDSQQRE